MLPLAYSIMARFRATTALCVMLSSLLICQAQAQSEVSVTQLLKQMLAIAANDGGQGHITELNALKQRIETLPKPARGDRVVARKANEQGLQAFKTGQYEAAKQAWFIAYQADPADVEITGNLGFIYLKLGDYSQALKAITAALKLAPGRSAAWANLADYFAHQDKLQQAVSCYALAFQFSQNPDKTYRFLQQQATDPSDLQLQQAAQAALQLSMISNHPGTLAATSAEDSLDSPLPTTKPTVNLPIAGAAGKLTTAPAMTMNIRADSGGLNGKYIGNGEGMHGELIVKTLGTAKIKFSISNEATWKNSSGLTECTGSVGNDEEAIAILNGNTATFIGEEFGDDRCQLRIEFQGNTATVTEEHCFAYHGSNCSLDGTYLKKPSGGAF